MSSNRGVQRLIDIMGDRIERAVQPGDFLMRVQRVGIERIADAERPGQFRSHLPRVLRVEVEVEKVEGFVRRSRKGLRCGRGHAIDELR